MQYTFAKVHKPKKGNDWYVYYSFRNPSTNKKELFKIRGEINRFKTNKEKLSYGITASSKINIELKNGWSPFKTENENPQSKMNIVEIFDEFIKIKKTSLRSRSYQHYKYGIDLINEYLIFIDDKFIKPLDFTNITAQRYSDWLITNKLFKGRSHNNQISNMKVFFNMLIDRDLISRNPFKNIKKKPVDIGGNLAYSNKQREVIKEYLEKNNHPLLFFVQFLYYCFIRPNELMQLQIKHIQFKDKSIIIPGYVSKNRKQSSVEIPDAFFQSVKNKYESIDPEYYLFGRGLIAGPIAVHRNRASASHKLVLDALCIQGQHTLYSWKHTGNVAAWEAGVSPYKIMEQNRHHSLEQTMTYARTLGVKLKTEFASKQPAF